MHKGIFVLRAVQAPGLVVPTQAAFVAVALAVDALKGDGDVYLRSSPVHLPVAATP